MSARTPEHRTGNLADALDFAVRQMLLDVHTAIPGIVETWDSATGRCVIQPAIDLLQADGTLVGRAPIANIPVLTMSSAFGYVSIPLRRGDTGMLIASERSIAAFKQTLKRAPPSMQDTHQLLDAVFVPAVFRAHRAPPQEGIVLSVADGTTYLSVEAGRVRIVTPGDTLIVQ